MSKVTESDSLYNNLEQMPTEELLRSMNAEDRKVPQAISGIVHDITPLVDGIVERMQQGGRLFYLGAGTSGRLGILDASECPPTFGVPHGLVIGLIAGGDAAIRKAVENAEDDTEQGWKDLLAHHITTLDTVVGIAASGSTPYVIGALQRAQQEGILTGCITCNPNSPVTRHADHPIVAVVGPEFVTGSTRMKAGTAQKLILNMISTATMIRLGKVRGNKMVDMQLSNDKLVDRGSRMIAEQLNIGYNEAKQLLLKHGSVRKAVDENK